jgi:hypothetical protein
MEERLAQPPVGGGIMGAAPVVPAPAKPAPVPVSPDAVTNMQRQMAEQNAIVAKGVQGNMDEAEKLRESMGVSSNKPAEDYRAKIMSERANSEDEAKRQKSMRLAEFFASWGSTPGPVLVAGMSALKKAIPGMIDDEKAKKKAEREADKIIYDIDHATRLEKLGRIDEAKKEIERAASKGMELNTHLAKFQSDRERDKAHAASAENVANINKESHIGAAEVTAKRMAETAAASADRTDRKLDEQLRFNLQRGVKDAERTLADTEKAVAAEKDKDFAYKNAMTKASQTRGVTPKERQAAQDEVNAKNSAWGDRITRAKEDADLLKSQMKEVSAKLGGGKKTDNETTAAPKGRPSLESFQKQG